MLFCTILVVFGRKSPILAELYHNYNIILENVRLVRLFKYIFRSFRLRKLWLAENNPS